MSCYPEENGRSMDAFQQAGKQLEETAAPNADIIVLQDSPRKTFSRLQMNGRPLDANNHLRHDT